MQLSDLQYELPPHLVAQHPRDERGDSTLLVCGAGEPSPRTAGRFGELFLEQLGANDLVVVNDSRVLHARLRVRRAGGGAGELLLLEPREAGDREGSSRWSALARPARRLRPGMELSVQSAADPIVAVRPLEGGQWLVELPVPAAEAAAWLDSHGELPLPPYIAPNGQRPEQYQTVYSRPAGSVAAPTAGLHFDEQLWQRMRARCEVASVTLHVGAGTFLPIRSRSLNDHDMHAERYEVCDATDAAVRSALRDGRRVVAIGTTTVRVLESVYGPASLPRTGSTSLFIRPGYRFGCVGAILTNFHLPGSTLLALVMAFAGEQTVRAAYREAIARELRFYSFGDAMFVHGPPAGDERR